MSNHHIPENVLLTSLAPTREATEYCVKSAAVRRLSQKKESFGGICLPSMDRVLSMCVVVDIERHAKIITSVI